MKKTVAKMMSILFFVALSNSYANQDVAYPEIALFQDVLRNERQFSTGWLGFAYLDEYTHELRDATSLAVFDMNGDGVLEVIVNYHYTIKLVLHYYDGEVYGSEFGIRQMNAIKTDGRFFASGGMWGFSIAELTIDGDVTSTSSIYFR